MDTLETSITATHEVLAARLATAEARMPTLDRPRDQYPATDTFLASVSRHNSAANAVLVPVARKHLPNGQHRANEFVHQSKRMERALFQVKAKLYGSSYAIRIPWPEVWAEARREFEATWVLEHRIVDELALLLHAPERHRLAEAMYDAELRAPTRPHPYVPHQGLRGKVARRVARQVDRFWDATEGRMIPEPVRSHDREHQGRMTQYLLADPHLPDEPPESPELPSRAPETEPGGFRQ